MDGDPEFSYDIFPEHALAYAVMRGQLSGQDMLHVVQTVHQDARWRHHFDAVWDCSRVEAHIVLPGDITPIIDETVEGETGRDVLVESPTVAGALIAELLAVRSRVRGKRVQAANTLEEACGVLGLDTVPDALARLAA